MEPTEKVSIYEALVGQLVSESPDEELISSLMNRLGMESPVEPAQRIALVLETMNLGLSEGFLRKESNDLSEHS